MLCARNDHVSCVRDKVAVDVLVNTRLHDSVPQGGLNAGNDHRLIIIQLRQNFVDRSGGFHLFLYVKTVLKGHNFVQLFKIIVRFVEYQRFHRRMQPEIQLVGPKTPGGADDRLSAEGGKHRPDGQQPQPNQAGKQIGNGAAEQVSQRLGIKDFSRPIHSDLVSVISPKQKNGEHHITGANRQTHGLRIGRINQRRAPQKPRRHHDPGIQHKMHKTYASHLNGSTHLDHMGITHSLFCFVEGRSSEKDDADMI